MKSLQEVERSGRYTNFGPMNDRLEAAIVGALFDGVGHCVTTCNATLALMIAFRRAIEGQSPRRRYALMPSFTFAATGHAAEWCGLTPLLCDIDPHGWQMDPDAEDRLIDRYRDEIALIVPCTTFGAPVDLDRYERLADKTGAALVVDAAAAAGSRDLDGRHVGAGRTTACVYSMHATKPFATLEGGFVYTGDAGLAARIRAMSNFGFDGQRSASSIGINAKLDEFTATIGLAQVGRLDGIVARRERLAACYARQLPDFKAQVVKAERQAHMFFAGLLPADCGLSRDTVIRRMQEEGIELGKYYDPHLAAQPHFRAISVTGDLTVTNDVSRRMLCFPLHDGIRETEVENVVTTLRRVCL